VWALQPDAPGVKDPGQPSGGRAKKRAHWTENHWLILLLWGQIPAVLSTLSLV
jgi:hypothetical protein